METIWFIFPELRMGRSAIKAILLVDIRENTPADGDATVVAALVLAFST
jgi:hypothetical protein